LARRPRFTSSRKDTLSSMLVRLILVSQGKSGILLYDGPSSECPPIPRPGDEIVHEKTHVRVECVRHHYWANQADILVVASSSAPESSTSFA